MACRVKNTSRYTVRLDLREGETLHLRPGSVSRPLREEVLYGNPYIAEWEAQGLIQRLGARMAEVIEAERPTARAKKGDVADEVGSSAVDVGSDLKDVRGVGESLAQELVRMGITSVAVLAGQDEETLAEIQGIGKTSAAEILESARELASRGAETPLEPAGAAEEEDKGEASPKRRAGRKK